MSLPSVTLTMGALGGWIVSVFIIAIVNSMLSGEWGSNMEKAFLISGNLAAFVFLNYLMGQWR